ncbi:MAG: CDP-2,3-bis-(O-geranylgeranyl)-sn-glycerol synthase [Candidatus Burarchaeum sp.]|nr:CDP-2,3-bis-(O-geranylgeranyl)-sn-glycerol synthase [Candidatus Burarchaeum sp.]MDO8339773.1 CDP-2,3-bis-(O-geranylgeranyl)-sn-glycerol synthase [Candidatus Burarchaeum sp.]
MDLLMLLILVLPAYLANASPVILGGGAPVDLGRKFFDGRRIFGDGKTWRGLIGGIATGTLAGALLAFLVLGAPYSVYSSSAQYVTAAFLMSCGALFGDLAGSFVKRRTGMKPGRPYILLDQLPFIIFALLFLAPFGLLPALSLLDWLIILVATLVLHPATNWVAHKLGWKKVPW